MHVNTELNSYHFVVKVGKRSTHLQKLSTFSQANTLAILCKRTVDEIHERFLFSNGGNEENEYPN